MKTYTVYFELFGKKMKATIKAKTMTKAHQAIKDKIIFHKTTNADADFKKQINIMDLLGIKSKP